jgi:hypothetical protein
MGPRDVYIDDTVVNDSSEGLHHVNGGHRPPVSIRIYLPRFAAIRRTVTCIDLSPTALSQHRPNTSLLFLLRPACFWAWNSPSTLPQSQLLAHRSRARSSTTPSLPLAGRCRYATFSRIFFRHRNAEHWPSYSPSFRRTASGMTREIYTAANIRRHGRCRPER